jgi:adenosylcobinamide amidohydrolase
MIHWETLLDQPPARVRRAGRFIVVDLLEPHRVLSTSTKNGGQVTHLRHLVNHQSVEGKGHDDRFRKMTDMGHDGYHDYVCAEVDLPIDETAVMGTAANMNYATVTRERDHDIEVAAIVTAGVRSNAICAGDPAMWRETREGMVKVQAAAGTINIILLVNQAVTPGVLARLAVTVTEAKTAALQQLVISSCYSADLATGTGTDQFCIATPSTGTPLTSASPHVKFGEIAGLAVRQATLEALRWQNGLEPSATRSLFHALSRYGLREASIFEDLCPLLEPADLALLRQNSSAVFHDPLVGAAAHALAAVLDRARHHTLPVSVIPEAAIQQAATLAVGVAAQPHRWAEFRVHLHERGKFDARSLVLTAIALGWSQKWRSH